LKQKKISTLTESTQSDEKFEYLGEFDFIFETNLGYESGNRVGAFDEKKQKSKISCKCTFKETVSPDIGLYLIGSGNLN
jgi:hypothetical protein